MSEEKISKKQQKALSFRKSKDERSQDKLAKKAKKEAKSSSKRTLDEYSDDDMTTSEAQVKQAAAEKPTTENGPEKKKRKTRRGKKGKGVNNGKGPRFILFVGNLPYDTQQAELDKHFKNSNPDRIRIRREKGIAFLEFDNDNQAIQSKMDHALGMHHSVFRERKINVELTAGGGGNSENRSQKLKEKNDKLAEERKEKVKKELAKRTSKDTKDAEPTSGGMHPARAALLKQ